jgi:hypothetical protein
MSLATNTRIQLGERLQADLRLREPSWTISTAYALGTTPTGPNAGDPLISVVVSGSLVAEVALSAMQFNGFNVVAELSSSAAQGLPETVAYLLTDTTQSQLVTQKLGAYVKQLGTAALNVGFVASASINEAAFVPSNIAFTIVNDARSGAAGQ